MPTSMRKKKMLNKIYYQLHQKKLSLQARKNYARKSDEIWKACPLALRQLANGKLPEKFDEEESSSLTPQPIPRSSSSPLPSFALSPYDVSADQLQPSITSFDMASALPHSTSTTFLHSHSPFHPATALDLPPFNSPQHLLNQQAPALPPPNFLPSLSQSFGVGSLPPTLPPFSHPPSSLPSSSLFAGSSLTPDHLQQPIQLLNSLQQSSISPTPPLPHFSTSAPPPPLPPPPPHAHLPTFPPPPHHFQPGSEAEGKGRESQFVSPSRVKLEMSTRSITHSRRRSSSGAHLDDQGVEYSSMTWNDEVLTLLCPVGGVEPYLAIPELIQKVFHNRSLASSQQRSELGVTTVPATLLQVYALRAKGSLNSVTGNVKLISISGAVKLASVSNIQIPGTVIQTLKKYSKEPLESLITPVGFAPATRPPSTHPPPSHPSHTTHTSHTSHPSQPSYTSHTSQPPPTSGALLHHLSSSSSSSQRPSRSTKGGKTVPQSPDDDASSSEDPAANVWPSKGVPRHLDLIDPGPFYTNTADGTYCLVKWGSEKLAALISSQKVHYMGLYQESPKSEDSQVITKTMYSGNLSSSCKCMECGQLNSKMAKKCLQCCSSLQGRSCPKCGRPNHNHSPECYKCGSQLPSTTTKWVYVGSHSGRAYRSQESNTSSLNSSLKYRAQISCLRCERLRNNGKFVCGRCGDIYWTKPVVPAPGDETEGTHQHGKKKKAISEPNWNVPPEHGSEELQSFAQNILNLDISDQLLTMVNQAETYARERVYTAEEELEGVEEEYQSSAKKREEKENFFNDVRAELSSLIAEVERQQEKLRHLNQREEEAKIVIGSHPEKISRLKEKIDLTFHLLMPETDEDKVMDCSQ